MNLLVAGQASLDGVGYISHYIMSILSCTLATLSIDIWKSLVFNLDRDIY